MLLNSVSNTVTVQYLTWFLFFLIRSATPGNITLCIIATSQSISRDSLAVLQHGDLVLDLVELLRHPAVFLVHLNALSQSHTGWHGLQEVREGASNRGRILSRMKSVRHQMMSHAAVLFINLDMSIVYFPDAVSADIITALTWAHSARGQQ